MSLGLGRLVFRFSPENPAVSKEMLARKTEKKYRRTIYRIITAHRNPMARGSQREKDILLSSMCGTRKEFSSGKMVAIITSLRKQSYAFITQLFLRHGYFESLLTNVPSLPLIFKNIVPSRVIKLIDLFIHVMIYLARWARYADIHIRDIYWNWKTEINPTAI